VAGSCTRVCGNNAVAANGSCSCLPGFEWASADPSDTSCVRPVTLTGCHVIGQDQGHTYLGEVGSCFGSASICNEYSSYGSQYGSDSIFNSYGTFGSRYGSYSAFNDYALDPPLLICDGVVEGCVTVNEFACSNYGRIAPLALCTCQ